jgi:transcription termination factor Rho
MGKKKRPRGKPGGGHPASHHNGRARRRRRVVDQRRPNSPDRDIPEISDAPLEAGYGLLEMHPNGYGFLRSPENSYSRERSDPFVPGTMIERYGLRQGVTIRGFVQQARKQQGPRLRDIVDVDGIPPRNTST